MAASRHWCLGLRDTEEDTSIQEHHRKARIPNGKIKTSIKSTKSTKTQISEKVIFFHLNVFYTYFFIFVRCKRICTFSACEILS